MISHEIRLVLFVIYMMEAVANMVLMRFNLTGFYVVYKNHLPLLQEVPYFCYLTCVYIFMVLNLLAGVSICTRDLPSILEEVLRSLISCFIYVMCSMLMLFDAESDLNVIKAVKAKKPNDQQSPDKLMHPYFKYNHLHSQAMASMVCSWVHMLHFLVAFYVMRFSKDPKYDLGNLMMHWLNNFGWIWEYEGT